MRYQLPIGLDEGVEIHRVAPRLIDRWKSEWLLKNLSIKYSDKKVFCFSNLPPAFKLKGRVVLYLQNALLLPGVPLHSDSLKTALRIMYERLWLRFFWRNIDEVWVQTNWMKEILSKQKTSVLVKPFLPLFPSLNSSIQKKYDFITISGVASHKRLSSLLSAWNLLEDGNSPSLLVVTDGLTEELKESLRKLSSKNVTLILNASREEIFTHYQESHSLIITSKIESFCLPIYEAAHFKLKIFAPSEPYAEDSQLVDVFLDLSSPEKIRDIIQENYSKM